MKNYMQKIFILLFVLSSTLAYAQSDCKVRGVVKDAAGETIPYATVGAYQGKKNITRLAADVDGVFAMTLKQGETYIFEISSVGYNSYKQTIELHIILGIYRYHRYFAHHIEQGFTIRLRVGTHVIGYLLGIAFDNGFLRHNNNLIKFGR